MGFIKNLLRFFLKFIVGVVVLLLALIAAGVFLNLNAERKAKDFCARIPIGEKLSAFIRLADQSGLRHFESSKQDEHRFMFQGWVFNRAECVVQHVEGTVKNTSTTMAGD